MNRHRYNLLYLLLLLLMTTFVSAEVLVLNLNNVEYTVGESVKVSGYVLGNDYSAINGTDVYLYFNSVLNSTETSDDEGYFEHYVTNVQAGTHSIEANTTSSSQKLTFLALNTSQKPTYKIIASSLQVPISNPNLTFTVKKYTGTTLTTDSYDYDVFYQNGSLYASSTGASDSLESIILPSSTGLYTVVVDNKKSFTATVTQFNLKFEITDKAGNRKNIFKPNGVAYFKVEGYSNGQKITNSTVSAIVTDPTGSKKTVTFIETSGIYNGNTNVTQTTPLQLRAGDYEVQFTMKDSSNNEQRLKGFFTVLGLDVRLDLVDKKPFSVGETVEFDVVVKNLENGNLISHNDTTYFFELENNGKFYDVNDIVSIESTDQTLTSEFSFTIPATFNDGSYFLVAKATSKSKSGKGKEYFEVMNTQLFIDLTDNYGTYRNFFQPGELAKINLESSSNISFVLVEIIDSNGDITSNANATIDDLEGSVSFNVPTTQAEYLADITITTESGIIKRQRWFSVQNYMSFMDVRNTNNQFQFVFASGEEFLSEVKVWDITSGSEKDLTGFVVKFDKIVSEETGEEYTNLQATKNTTYSDDTTGKVVYNIIPPSLENGFYRVEYTLVNTEGKSFKGKGWFGISAFTVDVLTYNENGQQTEMFSSGDSINITVTLSDVVNATATIHREFFDELSFNITDGSGSVLLTSALSQLPSESGWYMFGVDVETSAGEEGLGNGFFEIRNLNFRSISVSENSKFAPGQDIEATVVMEKSGSLVNQTNVSLSRLFRTRDGQEISATLVASPTLTNNLGRTTVTITPDSTLEAGDYFAELEAVKGSDRVFHGFGFKVVENKVIITINDADREFTSTDNVEINVKVTYQNDTPINGTEVNLTGLLNFNTWAPVSANKQGTTSSTGVATITLSAANFNSGTYAPIIQVAGMTNSIVGFGDGEFTIKPFSATVEYGAGSESFVINEDILINITISGTATVLASVEDINGVSQTVDYYYSNGVLTLNNELDPGEYFVDVAITQSSSSTTKRLWFEVIAPNMHVEPLANPNFEPTDEINFTYTIFTQGSNGWQYTNTTVNITSIENLWNGSITSLTGKEFAAENMSTHLFDLTSYNLKMGDYMLNFEIPENPNYQGSLYFRVQKNMFVIVNSETSEGSNDATIIVNTSGLSAPINHYLEGYTNYDDFSYTTNGSNLATGADVSFAISDLESGFYQATIKIVDNDGETFYFDTYFDIRVKDVVIDIPLQAYVGDFVEFNVTSSKASDTFFWIIDPFTQTVKKKTTIAASADYVENYTFNQGGNFMVGYGDTKWEVYPTAEFIDIVQFGYSVEWPFDNNRFVLSNLDRNFTFNVTSDLANTSLTLRLNNHFTGENFVVNNINTSTEVGGTQNFSFNLSDLGINNGPHEVQLTLEDGSQDPLTEYFFIDIFPDQFEMWMWPSAWEYNAGENVTLNIEVYDILNNWNKTDPSDVVINFFEDPFGTPISPTLNWSAGQSTAILQTSSSWATGNYRGEINISKGAAKRVAWVDFFVKGNDNLELFWNQNKWDYSSSETYELDIDARDSGSGASGVTAQLVGFEKWPESWDQNPTDLLGSLDGSMYNFSNNNLTDTTGRVSFKLDIGAASLATGGYTGRINVGGQIVWYDFSVRTYQVDAYPEEWEYGITDTIEVNVRARDIDTWNPLNENGNVTIKKIMKHEPGNWQPQEVNLTDLGVYTPLFEVYGGEALLEMQANQTALNLTQPYEFELQLEMNLSSSGTSEGWAWFRLSNANKPSTSIVDSTGSAPDAYYGGQIYSLEVTNVNSATLKNMWGPCGKTYNKALVNVSGTLKTNFSTPTCPGWYTLETEITRSEGYSEYTYTDFQIGSGTDLHTWGEPGIVPGVNFTIYLGLFGEDDNDPFCQPSNGCFHQGSWFGPLVNRTIVLKGIKDLDTFTYTDLRGLGINSTTNDFPSWMMPSPNQTQGGEPQMLSEGEFPGDTSFNLHPNTLSMVAGNKYDLVFSYTDPDSGDETEKKYYVQVEKFHVGISKNTDNIGANTEQYVWLKTTDLYGTAIDNCSIAFDSIYNDKDYQLVKNININNVTDVNGELVFTYTTPSLPGYYLVSGTATCEVDSQNVDQDIAYFIDVGAKNLEVDMKTRFKQDENIKVLITTKDRLGNPESQKLELNLMHDRDDYPQPVYSLGGSDCTVLDANQGWDHFDSSEGSQINNRFEVQTDSSGKLEIELCPMPQGEYMLDIFPMFEHGMIEEGPKQEGPGDNFGFFTDFVVGSGDVTVESALKYNINDTATMNIIVTNDDGSAVNGSIVAMDSILLIGEDEVESEFMIWELEEEVNITNGYAQVNFTIPSTILNEFTNETVPTIPGPADMWVMVEDLEGNVYSTVGMQYVIVVEDVSSLTAPASVKTSRLINLTVQTNNLSRYKVQHGVFFLKDNTEKEKFWMVENGIFLEDNGDGTSGATFQIMSPREPGEYFLGMPIFELGVSSQGIDGATALLIAPIEVTLDLVNITGKLTEDDGITAINNALVRIGKKEVSTNSTGGFATQVPKGKTKIEVELKDIVNQHTQFMKTEEYDFTTDTEINISFYEFKLTGDLGQTLFNISSPATDLSSMRLRMNVTINNTGSRNFTNFTIKAIARSGEETKLKSVEPVDINSAFFQNLYPGFETNEYGLTIRLKVEEWNGSSYVLINGVQTNSTVGAVLKKTYNVETYAVAGDGIDNDGDCNSNFTQTNGCTPHDTWYSGKCHDEELDNNKDDDCDGKIDEDLEGESYFEWCGNGFCSSEENSAGDCNLDCSQGYCGDSSCDAGEESWCSDDCSVSTCSAPNECLSDGTPYFCNNWNITEPANWCQSSCSDTDCWACETTGDIGSTQCEAVGCSLGEDGFGRWCFKQESCGPDSCWACHNSGECSGASGCEWEVDSYSPDGGWCNRPWTCDNECGACQDSGACLGSAATWNNVSCRWSTDGSNSWCEWNSTYGPAGAGEGGIIDNLWLDASNDTEDWQSVVDYKCWSGNCGSELTAGEYYIILDMGNTRVNLSINGTYFATLDNSGPDSYWNELATPSNYTFLNGTYEIEVFDMIGPDYIMWTVTFGASQGQNMDPELNITNVDIFNGAELITFNVTVQNLSSAPVCGGDPLDGPSAFESWRIGINSVPTHGCDDAQLGWLGEDFLVYFETNSTGGDMFPGFDMWNGSDYEEVSTVFPMANVNCTGNWISLTVNLTEINASADDNISTKFSTLLGAQGSENTVNFEYLNYTVTGG